MFEFKFADIGEGLHEGKVTEILVKVGDAVKDGDSLFSVETDKVTSEISSPVNGVIKEIKIAVDQIVHVGETVFVIDENASASSPAPQQQPKEEEAPKASGGGASVVGEVKVSDEVIPMFGKQAAVVNDVKKDILISPYARKYALDHKINLSNIQGSGPNGRILFADLQTATPTPTPTPVHVTPAAVVQVPAAPTPAAPVNLGTPKQVSVGLVARREKPTGLRNAIAKNLKNSWDNVAYTNLVLQVDVTELWNLRSSIKDNVFKNTGLKLTFLPYIAKATTIALTEFPIFGANYDDKTQELVFADTVNLGIAVDTERGLMVPNIKNSQALSVLQLANEINRLAGLARTGKLGGADMAQGHFTITNYGSAGALFGTPVIKYPEIAILGTGAIVDQAGLMNGMGDSSGARKVMYLTLAADHRWIDGAEIGRFLSRIKQLLENPGLLSVY